jgi:hypothetical protein
VIERDRHDHGHGRIGDDIRGVEAAAETDFDDRGIGRMLGKQDEGDGGQYFEDGDLLPALASATRRRASAKTASSTSCTAPALDADAVALVPIDQMRRGVDMGAVAAGFQQRAAEGGDRTLAVGAGHMDDGRQLSCGLPRTSRRRVMRSSDRSKPLGCNPMSLSISCAASLTAVWPLGIIAQPACEIVRSGACGDRKRAAAFLGGGGQPASWSGSSGRAPAYPEYRGA